MKLIALHARGGISGFVAVCDEDFDMVNKYSWHLHMGKYARARIGGKLVYMHRMIMGFPSCQVDHVNLDRKDNRRRNLRVATHGQNQHNQRRRKNNTSGFKGVSRNRGMWSAEITADGTKRYIGMFDTPEEAHAAYCEAAKRLHGEFARTA